MSVLTYHALFSFLLLLVLLGQIIDEVAQELVSVLLAVSSEPIPQLVHGGLKRLCVALAPFPCLSELEESLVQGELCTVLVSLVREQLR